MKKILKVVGGIIENSKKQILCALRPENKNLGNMWEFPGGKIEEGESCEEALKRELFEELNIKVKNLGYYSNSIKEYEDVIIDLTCYKCEIEKEENLKLLEHRAFLWLERKNLNSLKWVPTDITIMENLILDSK
ncbi:MAG: (deoxy)nucleoside triphosphate pyrophosphohydrolase [Cetobacterium sp.]|uniref:(deoxy)nucleoside triphosphate pyrophosphohydrolase n=1 Tax=Cetobacterium sp. TaxID=2071632 RepID=UPI003F2EF241